VPDGSDADNAALLDQESWRFLLGKPAAANDFQDFDLVKDVDADIAHAAAARQVATDLRYGSPERFRYKVQPPAERG
jgi:hypothetical protein